MDILDEVETHIVDEDDVFSEILTEELITMNDHSLMNMTVEEIHKRLVDDYTAADKIKQMVRTSNSIKRGDHRKVRVPYSKKKIKNKMASMSRKKNRSK